MTSAFGHGVTLTLGGRWDPTCRFLFQYAVKFPLLASDLERPFISTDLARQQWYANANEWAPFEGTVPDPSTMPRQANLSDCGVFVLAIARMISRGEQVRGCIEICQSLDVITIIVIHVQQALRFQPQDSFAERQRVADEMRAFVNARGQSLGITTTSTTPQRSP
jgi:hypothetical protein